MNERADRLPAPSAESSAAFGTVLIGRYRLDGSLGTGGMAEVFRARDLVTNRDVAVKILRGQYAHSREAVQRLKREGEVLTALRHPSLVGVEGAYEIDGGVFLVMELLEGETLGTRMKRGPMTPMELAPVVAGVAAGLEAAHAKNVVHRDLKPDNVFLVPDHASGREGALRVKLLDFGISKVWYGEKLTAEGQVLGTPRYMSPEQLGTEDEVDARVDVYALGVILYEALAGTPPFLASSPTDLIVAILHGKVAPLRSVKPHLSMEIEAVVMRAMARTRDARFASALLLAEAFLTAAGVGEGVAFHAVKGLPTRAMGSVRSLDVDGRMLLLQDFDGDEPSSGAMHPGTFTQMPAFTADAPADQAAQSIITAEGHPFTHGGAQRKEATGRTETAPERAIPKTSLSVPPSPDPVAATGPNYAPSFTPSSPPNAREESRITYTPTFTPQLPQTDSMPPPMPVAAGPSPWFWVGLLAAGLCAGGLTALAVIMLLHYRGTRDELPPPPRGSVAEPVDADVPSDAFNASDAAMPDAPPPDEEALPPGRDPEAPTGRDRRDRESRTGSQSDEPASVDQPGEVLIDPLDPQGTLDRLHEVVTPPPLAMDPLSQATRALRAGDAQHCVDILNDAMREQASAPMLRRRGDCLARLGDRDEAIGDYQRFCRLVPDHPAIPEVRDALARLGATCP